MATFLALSPAVFWMILAHLGRRYGWARTLVLLFFAVLNLMLLLDGIVFLSAPKARFTIGIQEMTFTSENLDLRFIGTVALVVGAASLLLMIPLVQRLLAVFLRIQPGDPVHTLALVYACYLVGVATAQTPLLEMSLQSEEQVALPASELVGQAAAMTLLAFVGVGLGIGRSVGETVRRLKLAWPGWRELRAAIVTAFLLIAVQAGLGALWMTLAPEQAQQVDKISKLLLGEFFNPLGAILIGLSAGIGEELVFRGALQPRFGLIITSLLFALVHSQYLFSFALVIVFVLGLGMGIVRNRVNTTAAILTHALYNATLVILATYGVQ